MPGASAALQHTKPASTGAPSRRAPPPHPARGPGGFNHTGLHRSTPAKQPRRLRGPWPAASSSLTEEGGAPMTFSEQETGATTAPPAPALAAQPGPPPPPLSASSGTSTATDGATAAAAGPSVPPLPTIPDAQPAPAPAGSGGQPVPPPAPSTPLGLAALAKGGRRAGATPVFVMLPLDTVDADGAFRYASTPWFARALASLASSGVTGVAVDVWWGAVERSPRAYDWSGYKAVARAVRDAGLKLQAVLAFHACGGNVGDDAVIPLPAWVSAAAGRDPDLFYCAAPRPGADCAGGGRNPEVLSLFADTAPGALAGRSPLQCYRDFMASFAAAFADELWGSGDDGGDGDGGTAAPPLIEEVVIGAGPCGELRYPSYPEPAGWRFPGVGEFQCYDRRALASLAAAAAAAGHPEWGTGGPSDAGHYNSSPDAAPFFRGWGGGWATPYGRFFVGWYAGALLAHGERLASAAAAAFSRPAAGGGGGGLNLDGLSLAAAAVASPPRPPAPSSAPSSPEVTRAAAAAYARSASLPEVLAAARAAEAEEEGPSSTPTPPSPARTGATSAPPPPATPRPFTLALKLAGVHWWYRCPSHAAELAAGYDNAGGSGGTYRAVAALAARHGFALTLTCVEMCDGQHPPEALCGPEGLLRQVREAAAGAGVPLGGENALPIVLPGGSGCVDGGALARVAYNSDAWGPPLQEEGRARAALYSGVAVAAQQANGGGGGENGNGPSPPAAGTSLPPMRSVTFLRLTPAMLEPEVAEAWRFFMGVMSGEGGGQ